MKAQISLNVDGELLTQVAQAFQGQSLPSAVLTRVAAGMAHVLESGEFSRRTEDCAFLASVVASLLVLRDDVAQRELDAFGTKGEDI